MKMNRFLFVAIVGMILLPPIAFAQSTDTGNVVTQTETQYVIPFAEFISEGTILVFGIVIIVGIITVVVLRRVKK